MSDVSPLSEARGFIADYGHEPGDGLFGACEEELIRAAQIMQSLLDYIESQRRNPKPPLEPEAVKEVVRLVAQEMVDRLNDMKEQSWPTFRV